MKDGNHKKEEYTLAEAADIVERSPQTLRNFCNDPKDPIEHKKFGRTFVLTARGLTQAMERIAAAKPGPKGPRKKAAKPNRRQAA